MAALRNFSFHISDIFVSHVSRFMCATVKKIQVHVVSILPCHVNLAIYATFVATISTGVSL